MKTVESEVVIGAIWSNRFINQMVDKLSKKASSSLYIAKENSRQVAMKSVIGLLSGNFKEGDTVKITVIGEDESVLNNDLKLAEELLGGELE